LDAALAQGNHQPSGSDDRYSTWLGRTVMRFKFVAEPRRAIELAAAQAADHMSLLQLFTSSAMILRLASHAAPRGAHPYRSGEEIVCAPGVFELQGQATEPYSELLIDSDMRTFMEQSGVGVLSQLARGPTCEYEEKLLDSLLIYAWACYQTDPDDKLLQMMTAVEMFGLRDAGEPIQALLADRIAFAISPNPTSREQIVENFKGTYALRSGRTHHGRSISDTERVEQFLSNIWGFFQVALRGVGRFRTRKEFLDELDRTRYGHGAGPTTGRA
jgi:hypothetical protein